MVWRIQIGGSSTTAIFERKKNPDFFSCMMWLCVCVCVADTFLHCFTPYSLKQDLPLNVSLFTSLVLPYPVPWPYAAWHAFSVGAGELNSGSHVCAASTLLTKHPRPKLLISKGIMKSHLYPHFWPTEISPWTWLLKTFVDHGNVK